MRFFDYLNRSKKKNSFYTKVLAYILAFSLLLISLVFFLTYLTVHNNAIDQSYATEQSAISNISYSASEMQDVAHSMLNQIRNNPQLMRLIYSATADDLNNIHSMYLLQNYAEASSWLDSAYIYNAKEGLVIYTYNDGSDYVLTFKQLESFYDKDILLELCDVQESVELPLLRNVTRSTEEENKSLFTYYIPVRNSSSKCDGCFVVNINPSRLMELSYGFTGDRDRQIIIADSPENYYVDSEYLLDKETQQAVLNHVFSSGNSQGQYTFKDAGIICVWSKADDSPLYYISCVSYSDITQYSRSLQQWFILFYLAVLTFSLAITFLMAHTIYKDYNTLHSRYTKEAKRYEENYNYIKNALLRNFFSLGSTNFVIGSQFEDNNISIESYKGYNLTLIKIKQYAQSPAIADVQSPPVRFTIHDSLVKFIPRTIRFEVVDMLQGYYLLISEQTDYSVMKNVLQQFARSFSAENACTISGITAENVQQLTDLPATYRKLIKKVEQLFFFEGENFVSLKQLEQTPICGKEQLSGLREHLITSLNTQGFERAEQMLSEFFDRWYEDYTSIYETTDLLVYDLSEFMQNFKRGYAVTIDFDAARFRSEIYRCETSIGVKLLFTNLIQDISSAYESVNNRSNYIDELLDLMERNYHDPNLNIDGLANMVGLSVSHMQNIFKTATGHSISSHLRNLRLQRAAKLLEETELSAGDIAARTGFGNTNYFYTVFKKHFSITPNEYRTKMKHK